MANKRGLIMGVANDHSLAWGIAQMLAAHGAELGFTYQGETLQRRVEPLAASVGSTTVLPCDVSVDSDLDTLFETIQKKWGRLDFLVHAIAFADKNELKGKYYNTSKENFRVALDVSCYSLTAICKRAQPLMTEGGSILTLTYYGAEKVVPNYNVMGVAKAALECSVRYLATDLGAQNVRVNALSAGPVRTLAASAVGDFRKMLGYFQETSPLKRNTTLEDVGGTALYLLSDLASGVTGENIHVDSGYHIVGMKSLSGEEKEG